jgi:hypothetical protein
MNPRRKANSWRMVTLAIMATAVMSCATPPKPRDRNLSLLRPFANNRVAGRAYLGSPSSGYEKDCDVVLLVPASEEYRKMVTDEFGNTEKGFSRDLKSYELFQDLSQRDNVTVAECDPTGNFEFLRVPRGRYYFLAQTTWLIRLARAGGYILRTIDITQSVENVLVAESAKTT